MSVAVGTDPSCIALQWSLAFQQSILEHKHFLKSRNPKEKHIRVQLENNGASKQMETQAHPKKLGINLKNLQGQYKPGK